jgi:hypothetical protein
MINLQRVALNPRSLAFLTVVFSIATLLRPCPCLAESNLVDRPRRDLLTIVAIVNLTQSDRELAEELEIWPKLVELYSKQNLLSREEKTVLRVKIRETILESYFDAASVQAEAEREQGILQALRQTLIAKRDRNIEINNATNFIAAGTLNTVGSVLGFSAKTPPFPGNLNQMLSGVVSATMSTYALKQSAGGKIRPPGNPTVIAELFGRPTDQRTSYPESVWRFLHGTTPYQPGKTRVQALEEHWIASHELEKHGSHRERLKLDLMSGVTCDKKCMTLDDLTDQINMISDISGIASLMTHHLRDLLHVIDSDIIEASELVKPGH